MYDFKRFLTCDNATHCIGRAESGGAVIFMAGKKGKRYILPNAKVMIHQPYGGVYGQTADIEIEAEEILKTKQILVDVMAKCTGQPHERVKEDSERDRFFDAKEAVAYGICDEVLGEDSSVATAVAAADGTKPKKPWRVSSSSRAITRRSPAATRRGRSNGTGRRLGGGW